VFGVCRKERVLVLLIDVIITKTNGSFWLYLPSFRISLYIWSLLGGLLLIFVPAEGWFFR
jgi:hypothetical protein